MSSNTFLVTILSLCAVVFAVSKLDEHTITECFLGNLPSMKTKVWRTVGNQKGDFYSIPGTYQSMLAPRNNGSVDYGANIRYNVPSYKNLAVPRDPVSYMDMVSTDYKNPSMMPAAPAANGGSCGVVKENFAPATCSQTLASPCSVGGSDTIYKGATAPLTPPGYNACTDVSGGAGMRYPEATSMLPVGNMTTINASGEVVQPVVYDRFVYANRNSRLRSQGDPIRGDLPIVPCAAEWFRPSVHPQLDLQEGAMNVLGGWGNDTTRNLSELIATASAGTSTTVAGVNLANEVSTGLGAALGDIITTAYP
jgi:hypothetical protein